MLLGRNRPVVPHINVRVAIDSKIAHSRKSDASGWSKISGPNQCSRRIEFGEEECRRSIEQADGADGCRINSGIIIIPRDRIQLRRVIELRSLGYADGVCSLYLACSVENESFAVSKRVHVCLFVYPEHLSSDVRGPKHRRSLRQQRAVERRVKKKDCAQS